MKKTLYVLLGSTAVVALMSASYYFGLFARTAPKAVIVSSTAKEIHLDAQIEILSDVVEHLREDSKALVLRDNDDTLSLYVDSNVTPLRYNYQGIPLEKPPKSKVKAAIKVKLLATGWSEFFTVPVKFNKRSVRGFILVGIQDEVTHCYLKIDNKLGSIKAVAGK